MCYKPRAVYFEYEYVVDNPYLTTLHKLHLTLMTVGVYGKADACTGVYMPGFGKELDVERHAGFL